MRTTLLRLAKQASHEPHIHKPMIHFLGKRSPPTEPHHPSPHPSAPPEIAASFSSFLQKLSASSPAQPHPSAPAEVRAHFGEFVQKREADFERKEGGEGETYGNFWDAPERYWRKGKVLSEMEIDAITSGGASSW